jgi:hypothetical protein
VYVCGLSIRAVTLYVRTSRLKNPVLSKRKIRMLLGVTAILIIVPACRREQATPLNMNQGLPPVALEARLDHGEATLGDRVTYTLSLNRMQDISTDLPELSASPEGLTPVDSGHSGPRTEGGRILEKRWTTYRADRIGTWVFPPVKMRYQQNGAAKEMETQEIALQVKSVLPQEMTDIHGIKPLEAPGRDLSLIFAFAVLVASLCILAFWAWFLWKKRRKPEASQPLLPPHVEAEQRLRELEAMGLLAKGEFKKQYFILSEIFRRYLERRFRFPAVERTTEEILADLDALNVTELLRDEVRIFLYNTDPVKFAGASCSTVEAGTETGRVRLFVAETSRQTPATSEEREHVAA